MFQISPLMTRIIITVVRSNLVPGQPSDSIKQNLSCFLYSLVCSGALGNPRAPTAVLGDPLLLPSFFVGESQNEKLEEIERGGSVI